MRANPNRAGFAAITVAILAVAADDPIFSGIFSLNAIMFLSMLFFPEWWARPIMRPRNRTTERIDP